MSDPALTVVEFLLTTHVYNETRSLDANDLPPRFRQVFWTDTDTADDADESDASTADEPAPPGEIARPLKVTESVARTATGVERPWEAVSGLLFTQRDDFSGEISLTQPEMAVEWYLERADEDRGAQALLLKLNTPGGQIVPSEDIRLAAEAFDGPTIAYATDVCASGGYDIAAGCDELWAREGSIVGSIGVIGSRVNANDLADQVGLSYERFAAGKYKDAGTPLKEMTDDERAYLQGIVDDYYDQFVETVADGREMDSETLRETEARIFLGSEAAEIGLVDELGTREDVEDALEDRLGESVSVVEFEPQRGLAQKFRGGAEQVAFALGAGVAGTFDGDVDGLSFRR